MKKINENNSKQRIRYKSRKQETIDQLENVFVFNLETHNDQGFAAAYAAGLYEVTRLRDWWDRDITVQEIETKRKNVTVFDGSNSKPVMNMVKNISENYEGDERTFIGKH